MSVPQPEPKNVTNVNAELELDELHQTLSPDFLVSKQYKDACVKLSEEVKANQTLYETNCGLNEPKPHYEIRDGYVNFYRDPLREHEREYLESLLPSDFLLSPEIGPKELPDAVKMLQDSVFIQFREFLQKQGASDIEDKITAVPELDRCCYSKSADLLIPIEEIGSGVPIESYKLLGKGLYQITLNPQAVEDSYRATLENPSFLEERVHDRFISEGFLNSSDFLNPKITALWSEFVKEPINDVVGKIRDGKKLNLTVKNQDKSLDDVLANHVYQPAKEKFQEYFKEIEQSHKNQIDELATYQLGSENKQAFQTLVKAYSEKPEFKKSPQLLTELKKQILPFFVEAEKAEMVVTLNKYSIEAPSRNATIVQMKQPSKEKEK